ncbi:MAG: ADP-ribosylglycohydrolase family protein [Coprococcus sp.]
MAQSDMNDKTNTLKSAIYGLAVGDALSVPYEFKFRGAFECTDMIGYGTHNQPEGTWSDDTSMALATCASIKACGRVDVNDIRDRFRRWLKEGAYSPFVEVFDCGIVRCGYRRRGCVTSGPMVMVPWFLE